MKTEADYYREVEYAQEYLRAAEADLRDAKFEHDQAYKRLATAEHDLAEFIEEKEKLNPETGLPHECIVLATTAAREVLYFDHLIRVAPAHSNRRRWLLVIYTPRGECMFQQWSREEHKAWTDAVLEAIEAGGLSR